LLPAAPSFDARRVVQILPDGNYCLASFWENGRRYIGTRLSLDEVEKFLARCEPIPTSSGERTKITCKLKAETRNATHFLVFDAVRTRCQAQRNPAREPWRSPKGSCSLHERRGWEHQVSRDADRVRDR